MGYILSRVFFVVCSIGHIPEKWPHWEEGRKERLVRERKSSPARRCVAGIDHFEPGSMPLLPKRDQRALCYCGFFSVSTTVREAELLHGAVTPTAGAAFCIP